MHRLRLWVRNVFGFSQSETNGFLILLPVMLLILFSYPIYRALFLPPETSDEQEQVKIDSLLAIWDFNPSNEPKANALFEFDPNIASKAEFDSLGMPSYLADRILNYRSKGGRFRKPEDLGKIYGMDSSLYQRLYPFIIIQNRQLTTKERLTVSSPASKKSAITEPQDLNTADTTQLKRIRGVGSVLAGRIIKYRTALGGFIDPNQVKEVYGLDTGVVKLVNTQFYIDPAFSPIRLNINNASESNLSNHPYIRSKIAKSIVAYRFQHGSFKEITDLLKIELIDPTIFDRIRPYLTIE